MPTDKLQILTPIVTSVNGQTGDVDVRSDWNQNDDTKPDYVKNRPFYTGNLVETVMLPETTITIVADSENLLSSSFTYSFEVGQTYVITFDGIDTEYTAYEVQGLVFVGDNFSSVTGGSGYVVTSNNGSIVLSTVDSSLYGSHTIAIKMYNQEIVKVDEKYLPESAFTDAEWSKISNKIVDYKQQSLSLSVSGEQIPMRSGDSYSENKINDNLKFEDGKVYEINGSITLYNPVGGNASVLNINGYYTCSNGKIVFGSCYDTYHKKNILVSLYSSDSVSYQGMLCISSTINVDNTSFTFDINITVTGEVKQLPDICIGENIQRVGDDIILSSSTPNSTKKFKFTVDDDYNVSATNTSDSVSKTLATTEYVDNSVSNPLNITSATVGQIAKISAVDDTGKPTTWETINIPTPFKPEGKSYLTFSSPSSFTLSVNDATKHWDGTLEYFASNKTWTTWDGTTTLSSVENDGEHVLYLRGTGNTVITGDNQNYRWVLTGSDISCIGNIENLLDYETVVSGNHPTMANYCYANMFRDCTSLIQAPELPATTLASQCYSYMFQGCTSLIQAPALPATTLTYNCYANMFRDCTSLTQAPALPATTLASQCYSWMFQGCTSLTKAPELPATTLANYCYYDMFRDCTSLTQSPALQATTLADYCYEYMFAGCLALTQVPALPATTLAFRCYYNMFRGCTSLKLSSTKIGEYTQEYCIPSSGTGTTSTDALSNMFTSTGGTFTETPSINTTYYLSSDNIIVRDTEVATLREYVGSMIDVAIGNAIGGSY